MNAIETLLDDEKIVIEKYRRAKVAKHSTVEIFVQDGHLVHINLTEKFRPDVREPVRRTVEAA